MSGELLIMIRGENIMIKTDIEKCTGCGACVQCCPQHCIDWNEGKLGFRYPEIDETMCIKCGRCESVCPIYTQLRTPKNQKAYAAVHIDAGVLNKSTSGGAFTALAEYVLNRRGRVFGCAMDQEFQVKHICIENSDELSKLRGSKYVQSDINTTYSQAKSYLENGEMVLFSGTPCQIAGLYGYLGKEYTNLITVDIVCHGVGSQRYFDKYLYYAEKKYGELKELRFRDKEASGWSCGNGIVICSNGKKRPYRDYDNYYYWYFTQGDIFRQSCYSCKYANSLRQGDFTLGDFWGIEALGIKIDAGKGCSLLLSNTEKADDIIQKLKNINIVQVDLEDAIKKNAQLLHPTEKSLIRNLLEEQYKKMDADDIQNYFVKSNRKTIFKGWIKSMVPYSIRVLVRKFRK